MRPLSTWRLRRKARRQAKAQRRSAWARLAGRPDTDTDTEESR